ncbi:MAG: phosphonopyruvate decarboxylase [Rhodospirillales bacterium]|nr:phosphonopyruvate decarboxylase [Rhodospirillales bacterium]
MIPADAFLKPARAKGVDFFSGVPCSLLTPIINRVISGGSGGGGDFKYVAAASEGEAVAISAGAWLAGHTSAVMFQNSGLGNAVNPLTSLNFPFRIPALLIVTWRGGPGFKDEPQHELMGEITPDLLDVLRIPHRPFPKAAGDVEGALEEALTEMNKTGIPFAFIMEKGDVESEKLNASAVQNRPEGVFANRNGGGERTGRYQTLERLLDVLPEEAAVIAPTGKSARELFTIADRPQHLYQVGSMGCAAPMGLGVALNVERPVVVIDGDGAVLMKMGALATVGAYAPENLIHIVLDNGTYDSTGGQPTVSPSVEFAEIAVASGYASAVACDGLDAFSDAVGASLREKGPHLIHMRIAPGSKSDLGRPTIAPRDVARRFRDFLAGG